MCTSVNAKCDEPYRSLAERALNFISNTYVDIAFRIDNDHLECQTHIKVIRVKAKTS